ncbi:O-antigen ligase family protein [Microseira sp. BLCC-F43]|uniref:O-antigen ligase family protein n=1 Tax=Microseira sp. BLCC-F43 TaxID=3153602 RepID=UPI0035B8444C
MTNYHPKSQIQNLCWNFAQIGLLLFPIMPALAALPLVAVILLTLGQQFNTIIRRPLNWGIAIFSLGLVITSTLAFKPSEAFLGLGNFLPFFLLFVAFSELIQTPFQLRRIAWILVIPSVPIVILGLGQLFLNWSVSGSLANILGSAIAPNGNPPGRMASVFMYANIFAAYLTITFILALGLLIENLGIGNRSSVIGNGKENYQLPITNYRCLFLSIAVVGNAIALILTNSRNGWGIAALAILAFALYLGWRWLVTVVAGITSTILWSAFGPDPIRQWLRAIVPAFFWARLTDDMFPNRPVALMRVTQWQFVASMIQQRPWTGWGLRNFTPLYEEKMHLWLGHPHNLFLMLTAETGIPATILFCSLVGWVIAKGVLLLNNFSGQETGKLIFFTYLVAFGGCILFNTVDVTLFDFRVNTFGWLLLAAIGGVVNCIQVKIGDASVRKR